MSDQAQPIVDENAQVAAPVKKTRAPRKAAAAPAKKTTASSTKKGAVAKKTSSKKVAAKSLSKKSTATRSSARVAKAEAKGRAKRSAVVDKKRKATAKTASGKKKAAPAAKKLTRSVKIAMTPEEKQAAKIEKAKKLSTVEALEYKTGPTAFKTWLENRDETVTFSTLRSYINTIQSSLPADPAHETYRRQKGKMNAILRILNERVGEGESVRRRVPGTGTKEVKTFIYADTPANQRKGCVGKSYEKVVYTGGEFVEVKRKRIKNSRLLSPEEKKIRAEKRAGREPSLWMKATELARAEFPDAAKKCVLFKKTLGENPTEAQIFANKVYLRAKQIHADLQAQKAPVAAAPAEIPA
jgi:hypothetical protein